jgi:hypothetical protein
MKQIVVPSISIVVPVKDEEITIETFIDWCLEGLAHFGGKGQILLLDGSTQTMTRKLAERAGVQVLNRKTWPWRCL